MPDKDREADDDAWDRVTDRIARGMAMTPEERLEKSHAEERQLRELLWRVVKETGRRCEWREEHPDAAPCEPEDSFRGLRRVEGKRWVPVCNLHMEEGERRDLDVTEVDPDVVMLDDTAQGLGWDEDDAPPP